MCWSIETSCSFAMQGGNDFFIHELIGTHAHDHKHLIKLLETFLPTIGLS